MTKRSPAGLAPTKNRIVASDPSDQGQSPAGLAPTNSTLLSWPCLLAVNCVRNQTNSGKTRCCQKLLGMTNGIVGACLQAKMSRIQAPKSIACKHAPTYQTLYASRVACRYTRHAASRLSACNAQAGSDTLYRHTAAGWHRLNRSHHTGAGRYPVKIIVAQRPLRLQCHISKMQAYKAAFDIFYQGASSTHLNRLDCHSGQAASQ